MKSGENYLCKGTIGIITNDIQAYSLHNTQCTNVTLQRGATYKIIGFNLYNKRVKVFLTNQGKTDVHEISYVDILNNSNFNNPDTLIEVESILISYKEVSVWDKIAIKSVLLYTSFAISVFLLGVFVQTIVR